MIGSDARPLEPRPHRDWQEKERAVVEKRHLGKDGREVARNHGISETTLYNWNHEYEEALEARWNPGWRSPEELRSALDAERARASAAEKERDRAWLLLEQELAISRYLRKLATPPRAQDPVSLRQLLAAYLEVAELGLTQEAFAEKVGLPLSTLKLYLAAARVPTAPRPESRERPRPERNRKIEDRCYIAAVETAHEIHPEWGPRQVALFLGNHGIELGKSSVATIFRNLGLSRSYRKKERSEREVEYTCPDPLTASDLKRVPLKDGGVAYFMPIVHLVFRVLLGFALFRAMPTSEETKTALRLTLDEGLGEDPFAHKTDHGTETKGDFAGFLRSRGIHRWTGFTYHARSNAVTERLIESYDQEVLAEPPEDFQDLEARTARWLLKYDLLRPHEACGGVAPLWQYLGWLADPHERLGRLEELLESIEERAVGNDGRIEWNGQRPYVGRCFSGKTVGVLERDGWISIWIDGRPLFKVTTNPKKAAA
jgi:transposase InsO family protein